ncbi:MAG: ABC transporter permease [Bacteroidetes bacterium]|nr:ABC transporter permease [Bacteroidota bacterium]
MRNLWLVLRREYTTRVLSPVFWLVTFLAPVLLGLLMVLPVLLASNVDDDAWTVYVLQDLPLAEKLSGQSLPGRLEFVVLQASEDSLRRRVLQESHTLGIYAMGDTGLKLPTVTYCTNGSPGMNTVGKLHEVLRTLYREQRLLAAGVPAEQLAQTETQVTFKSVRLSEQGEQKGSVLAGYAIGYALAMVNYLLLLIYGSMVMQSVMEEKTSRIMEVLATSVKPVHLMLGKILGIGAVGFTQVILWLVLGTGVSLAVGAALVTTGAGSAAAPPVSMEQVEGATVRSEAMMTEISGALAILDWQLLGLLVFFFICGFLLYSSLFAAVGSSVDQMSDAQQLTPFVIFPIVVPILALSAVVNDPNGALAFWFSMIPLFSPIIMLVRVAAGGVPLWQQLLSMAIMLVSVWGVIQLAARIYRVGILTYGKKPTIREMLRWLRLPA